MSGFDPSKHITRIKFRGGPERDYLPVAARVMWLRADHPGAKIETWLITDEPGVRSTWGARVTLADGSAATGFGSRKAADQRGDYFEAGETRALGRALAHLGIATEFIDPDEIDEGADQDGQPAAVDSGRPVTPRTPAPPAPTPAPTSAPEPPPAAVDGAKPTAETLARFWPATAKLGWGEADVNEASAHIYGVTAQHLSAVDLRQFFGLLAAGTIQRGADGRFAVAQPPATVGAAS